MTHQIMATVDSGDQMQYLGDYLFIDTQAQVVVVGPVQDSLIKTASATAPVIRSTNLAQAEQLARKRTGADTPLVLVLVVDADNPTLEQQLGQAVRAFPHRVLVNCNERTHRSAPLDTVFFALGFRRLNLVDGHEQAGASSLWYEYRLSHYKTPPDWLNARFWANPERFELSDDTDDDYQDDWSDEEE